MSNGGHIALRTRPWLLSWSGCGKLSEVEPVGDCIVNIDSVTDAFPWKHALPKEQK